MTDRMTPEHEQILKNWPGPTVYMNHIRTLLTEIHALRKERDGAVLEVSRLLESDVAKDLRKDNEFLSASLKDSQARYFETAKELAQCEKDRAEYQAAFEEAHQLMMDMEGKWLRG